MLKLAVLPLALAAIVTVCAPAQAGGYERYAAPQTGGTVNNYYGPTTVYQGGAAPSYSYGYSAPAQTYSYDQSAYGSAYANAYANAYAGSSGYQSGYGSYDADYGAPWGQPFAGGVGYSPHGNYGGYGYGMSVYGARMDPWNGYYGGRGNGYW